MDNDFISSLILGAIQGLTEFLPVSSSGHLSLIEELTGMKTEGRLLLNVLLHAGTLAALLACYRRDLLSLSRTAAGLLRGGAGPSGAAGTRNRRLIVAIIAADAVTFVMAILLYRSAEALSGDLRAIGLFLAATGIMLLTTLFMRAPDRPIGWKDALVIGFFQGIAVLPGISRSGWTIIGALLLTGDRREAVRFSFLAAIPVLAGAALLEAVKGRHDIAGNLWLYLPGTIAAFFSGCLSLKLIEKLAVGGRLHWFAAYLIPVGAAVSLLVQ